jgi:hypothetical protein
VLWLVELQIRRGRKVLDEVRTVNSNSRRGSQIRKLDKEFPESSSTVKVYCHHPTSSPFHPNAFVLRMIHVASDSYNSVGNVVV